MFLNLQCTGVNFYFYVSLTNVTAAMDSTDEQSLVNSHDLNTRVQHFPSVLEDYWTRWQKSTFFGSGSEEYLEKCLLFMTRITHVVSGNLEG